MATLGPIVNNPQQPQPAIAPTPVQVPQVPPSQPPMDLRSPPQARLGPTLGPVVGSGANPEASTENFFAGLGNSAARGFDAAKMGGRTLAWLVGQVSDDDLIAGTVLDAQQMAARATTPGFEAGRSRWTEANGLWESLGVLFSYPEFTANIAAEQATQILTSITGGLAGGTAVGAVGGGPVGALAGAAAGAGLAGAANAWGGAFWDYMGDHGVDITDPVSIRIGLEDAELVNNATWAAARYAGATGAFEALGGTLGGKIATRFWLPELSTTRRVGAVASGVAVDAAAGGVGEIAGGLAATGTVDWKEVAAELVLGLGISGLADVAVPSIFHQITGRSNETRIEETRNVAAGLVGPRERTPIGNAEVVDGPAPQAGGAEFMQNEPEVSIYAPMGTDVYSPVMRAIDTRLPGRGTVDQMLATLRSTNGVKEQELRELGIEEYVRDIARGGSISKSDFRDLVEERIIAKANLRVQVMDDRYSAVSPAGASGRRWGGNNKTIALRAPTPFPLPNSHDQGLGIAYDPKRSTIAWARVQDTPDGSLLVHEIQSDLHQGAREVGYADERMTYDRGRRKTAVERMDAWRTFQDQMRVLGADDVQISGFGFASSSMDEIEWSNSTRIIEEKYAAAAEAWTKLNEADFHVYNFTSAWETGMLPQPHPEAILKGEAWANFMLRYVLQYAAKNGYKKVYLAGGKLVDLAQGGVNPERAAYYDGSLRRALKKEAERRGALVGQETVTLKLGLPAPGNDFSVDGIDRSRDVDYQMTSITLTAASIDELKAGVPLYQENPDGWTTVEGEPDAALARVPSLEVAAQAIKPIFKEIISQFHFSSNVRMVFHRNRAGILTGKGGRTAVNPKGFVSMENGEIVIRVFLPEFTKAAELYATVAHELGHAIMADKLRHASPEVKYGIEAAYQEYRTSVEGHPTLGPAMRRRNNVVWQTVGGFSGEMYRMGIDPEADEYWIGKQEWFAEQVAKWMTTDAKPLSIANKFFASLARQLKAMQRYVAKKLGLPTTADGVVAGWLNSFLTEVDPFMKQFDAMADAESHMANAGDVAAAGLNVDTWAGPRGTATVRMRQGLARLFGGTPPKDLAAMPAIVDKMHWGYKLGAGVWQLAKANPRLRALQTYKEASELLSKRALELMSSPWLMLKRAQKMGGRQQLALVDIFDDYMNYKFLPDEEYDAGVRRRPNEQELADLVKKHGVNEAGLVVFSEIIQEIDNFGDHWLELAIKRAMRTTNPDRLAEKIAALTARRQEMKDRPYFPMALRYGKYGVSVRDKNNSLMYVDMTSSVRKQTALLAAVRRHFPDATVAPITFDRDVGPLMSVYSGMIGEIPRNSLSATQKEALEYLAFEENPASLFRDRAQIREKDLGRNSDFFRLLAGHFFHSSRHIAKMEYEPTMRDAAKELTELKAIMPEARPGAKFSAKQQVRQNKKLTQISDMVQSHLEFNTSHKRDWAFLKALGFHWLLGFNVAAAAIQLTQTPMFTAPFLMSKFGDIKGLAAVTKAMLDRQTYYKRGTLADSTSEELQILHKLEELGITDESMASEFAGAAEGRNLRQGFGGTKSGQLLYGMSQASSFMFRMSEKSARRIAALAATRLALANPEAKYAKEAQVGHEQLYQKLRDEGWTERSARALIVAKDTVDWSQGKYQKESRPQFLRGIGGVIFLFKSYTQQMLVSMWHNKGAGVRSLLVITVLAGFMGLPGAEDLLGLIKGVGYMFFGKDWDVEKEARELMVDSFGFDAEGADNLLHGTAREGFGLPAILGLLGVDFLPEVDRSASVGFGRILPVNVNDIIGPNAGSERAVSASMRDAGGAVLGTGMQFWNALTSSPLPWDDPKRWESAVPRWMSNLSQMVRVAGEGRERSASGSTVLDFDRNEPGQMGEIIAMGLGYQPTRLARQWDRIIAQTDAVAYWDVSRQILLTQFDQAIQSGSQEDRDRVTEAIRNFNASLPDFARGKAITSESLRSSLMGRVQTRARQELGLPVRDTDVPIYREIQRLYPGETIVGVRRVQ